MNREELAGRTKRFALAVMQMTDGLPRNTKAQVLARQIIRSATSVASGYRAAGRARSAADWIDKIGRVLEEADETMLWLELLIEGGVLDAVGGAPLQREAGELTAIFAAIHRTSKNRHQSPNPKS